MDPSGLPGSPLQQQARRLRDHFLPDALHPPVLVNVDSEDSKAEIGAYLLLQANPRFVSQGYCSKVAFERRC